MSLDEDILIEKFLKGELSINEEKSFKHMMEKNSSFKERVMLEKELFHALDDKSWSFISDIKSNEVLEYKTIATSQEISDLKTVLKTANDDYKNKSKQIVFRRIMYSAAAMIALFLAVYFINQGENKTYQELYVEYVNLNELPSLVSRSDNADANLAEAQKLFEDQDYSKALEAFNLLGNNNASLLLYKGISQMEVNLFTEAEATFNTLINSDFLDAEKGYWYKALLHLKNEDIDRAKKVLSNIVDNSYYNYKIAEDLLKRL